MTGRDNDKSGICCEQQAGPPTSFQAAITQELNSGIGYCSAVNPGCLSLIRIFSIQDPNFFHPGSASKNLSILIPKIVS
jgi:hypothetical protein